LTTVYTVGTIVLLILTFLCLTRAALGPTAADRVVAINVIGTKTMVIIALISFLFGQEFFLDVSLVYALISFIMTIGVAKYMQKGALS
jgi:multicomponent Na+:H+ antiporter subunit F